MRDVGAHRETARPWHYYFSEPFFALQIGLAHLKLGDNQDAVDHLTAGLDALPVDQRDAQWAQEYRVALASGPERRIEHPPRNLRARAGRAPGTLATAQPKEAEMSMLRTLKKAVRLPHRRGGVDLSHPARSPLGSSVVNCVVYLDGVRQIGHCPTEEAIGTVRKAGNGFVWIGLHEPTEEEFSGIARLFGLHPLAVEDAVHAHQRPKLERYDGSLFAVFKPVSYVEHDQLTATSEVVDTGEIMVFTGPDFVITVRHGRHGSLGPLREALEARPEQLAKGPSAVLHAVADHVVDGYLAVADAVQDDMDDVESDVFSPTGRGADAGRIYQLKRELLELKRAVAPLDRPLQALAQESIPLVHPDIGKYFRDVADHLARVCEQITAFDDLLNSILQANLAQVTVAQNEDMRKISAWVAIIAVPTMFCGVYGMNFDHMPELRWTYGYPFILGVIAVTCTVIHRGFRRNGWL